MSFLTHPEPHDSHGEHDFWPTPPRALELLLTVHPPSSSNIITEPSAGDGAIVRVLVEHGYEVAACEIRPECEAALRRWTQHVHIGDFLSVDWTRPNGSFVGNPPYTMPAMLRHVEKCHSASPDYVALLLPTDFMHSAERLSFNWRTPLSGYYPIVERLSFSGDGKGGSRNVAWHVWDRMMCGQRIQLLSMKHGVQPAVLARR